MILLFYHSHPLTIRSLSLGRPFSSGQSPRSCSAFASLALSFSSESVLFLHRKKVACLRCHWRCDDVVTWTLSMMPTLLPTSQLVILTYWIRGQTLIFLLHSLHLGFHLLIGTLQFIGIHWRRINSDVSWSTEKDLRSSCLPRDGH